MALLSYAGRFGAKWRPSAAGASLANSGRARSARRVVLASFGADAAASRRKSASKALSQPRGRALRSTGLLILRLLALLSGQPPGPLWPPWSLLASKPVIIKTGSTAQVSALTRQETGCSGAGSSTDRSRQGPQVKHQNETIGSSIQWTWQSDVSICGRSILCEKT
jgi:hypothetical protein